MFVSNTMANAIAPRELASTSGSALDHYTCTHVEALRWLLDIDGPDIDEDELKAASHSFGELLSLMRSHPAETLEGLLRTDFEPCIAPLKRMFVRACVVRLLGQTAIDEDESLRIDVQSDALIADTWPVDPKAQEALFRRAGVKRKRMRDVIREIFFRPRAVYDQDDVMQMLGISDRMFADIVDEGELRRTMARSLSACC